MATISTNTSLNSSWQFEWPARCPDTSPIERVWDSLSRRVNDENVTHQNLQQLEQLLNREWQDIPQQKLDGLIYSMIIRVHACIRANGGHTVYWLLQIKRILEILYHLGSIPLFLRVNLDSALHGLLMNVYSLSFRRGVKS